MRGLLLAICMLLFAGCSKGEVTGCVENINFVDNYYFSVRLNGATISEDAKEVLGKGPTTIIACRGSKCGGLLPGDRVKFLCRESQGWICRLKQLDGRCGGD